MWSRNVFRLNEALAVRIPSARQALSRACVFAVALGAIACVPEFEDDLSQITAPRLVAVRSTPAEAEGGEQVTLEALVATPEGEAAPDLDWTLCLARKPLTELGPVNPACLEPDDGSGAVEELGAGTSVSGEIPRDTCKLFGPQRPTPVAGEPAGRPVDPDVTGGFYQPFAVSLAGEPTLFGLRIDCDLGSANRDQAIAYRQQYRRNENPRVQALVTAAGDSLEPDPEADALRVRPGERLQLTARWNSCPSESQCGDGLCTANEDRANCAEDCDVPRGCTGAESYVWYDADSQRVEPRREAVSLAWYASRGRFAEEQTGVDEGEAADGAVETDNVWVAPDREGAATLWVVIRDSRGGQSWERYRVEVAP